MMPTPAPVLAVLAQIHRPAGTVTRTTGTTAGTAGAAHVWIRYRVHAATRLLVQRVSSRDGGHHRRRETLNMGMRRMGMGRRAGDAGDVSSARMHPRVLVVLIVHGGGHGGGNRYTRRVGVLVGVVDGGGGGGGGRGVIPPAAGNSSTRSSGVMGVMGVEVVVGVVLQCPPRDAAAAVAAAMAVHHGRVLHRRRVRLLLRDGVCGVFLRGSRRHRSRRRCRRRRRRPLARHRPRVQLLIRGYRQRGTSGISRQ